MVGYQAKSGDNQAEDRPEDRRVKKRGDVSTRADLEGGGKKSGGGREGGRAVIGRWRHLTLLEALVAQLSRFRTGLLHHPSFFFFRPFPLHPLWLFFCSLELEFRSTP